MLYFGTLIFECKANKTKCMLTIEKHFMPFLNCNKNDLPKKEKKMLQEY